MDMWTWYIYAFRLGLSAKLIDLNGFWYTTARRLGHGTLRSTTGAGASLDLT